MLEFDEGQLRFRFDEQWRVLKWDDHAAFRGGLHRQQHTKGVDFFGVYQTSGLFFIEAKDLRQHRIENKTRLRHGDMVDEIACKVRDTISSVVWACDRDHHHEDLPYYLKRLFSGGTTVGGNPPHVVLWLEEDLQPQPVHRSTLAQSIKRALNWLNPRVVVRDRSVGLPGLTVTGRPRTA